MDEVKKERLGDLILWILLLGIIAFSVYRTTATNIELEKAQGDLERVLEQQETQSRCTQQFLGQSVIADEQNNKYTLAQIQANSELQKVQQSFLETIISPDPVKQSEFRTRLEEYFAALQKYNRLVELRKEQAEKFPYPKIEEYVACLNGETKPPQDPPKPPQTPDAGQTGTRG